MPAQSKQQQKFMGMVHALKKGEMEPSDASPELKKAAQSMSDKDAKDFASTPHKGLPKKVKQEILNKLKEYANKMGTNTMGGDDYTSSKKGGLRDNDGYDNVDYNKDMPMDESMMSTLDQIRKDSKSVKDFIKNVLLDRNFKDMKSDKDFIKYLGSIYEGKLPNNWMQGRVSDYHTQLRGKKKDYSGGTNFKKDNSGQPDLEDEKSIDEVAPCWNGYKQVGMKNKGGKQVPNCVKESVNESKDEVTPKQLVKIQSDIRKINPKIRVYISKHPVTSGKLQIQLGSSHPSVKGDDREIHQIYKVLKKHTGDWRTGTMFIESVNESSKQDIIKDLDKAKNDLFKKVNILIDKKKKLYSNVDIESPMSADEKKLDKDIADLFSQLNKLVLQKRSLKEASFHAMNNPRFKKATSDLVKNKKIKNPETKKDVALTTALNDKDHPAHNQAKSLFQRLKSRLVGEYGQRLDLSYLEDEEARLDGTPLPKDAIDRDLNETMIRRAIDIAQELLPKDTWRRFSNDGQKNQEFVKNVVRDLTQSLNKFYKNHDISVRIKENQEDSNVDMVLGVLSILRQIEDKENRQKVGLDMIKKFKEQNIDFDYKEFLELMKEYNK